MVPGRPARRERHPVLPSSTRPVDGPHARGRRQRCGGTGQCALGRSRLKKKAGHLAVTGLEASVRPSYLVSAAFSAFSAFLAFFTFLAFFSALAGAFSAAGAAAGAAGAAAASSAANAGAAATKARATRALRIFFMV